ncbi:peptide chain release factor N(5)-glutamine methyltransferase [Pleurocapsa sp. CCALA 161]|uniref:peptide chain release factor N(5)-glutamine methyltransferase n=1 Tax=Pleurocapsa sp. CCALA 161 TaxID=2107688 RepID=UPI000D05546F|nr:peptide chain release factor N(5)-glutamine methyltransferase [Pleurocapsa sp. CCALA 161]PSB07517.1 peptide chain release factor N(5)-glutamine methyltransferase [Pleurocapsa sp. CCALA 161]
MNSISSQDLYSWYRQAKEMAIANQIDPDEVDWLIKTITNLDSLSLRLGTWQKQPQINSAKSLSELTKLWQQRLQERLPVQYLVETVFWRRFQLKVTPAVLIPRPETELIIDIALANSLISSDQRHWVDLGTGSGAIAIGLADVFPTATVHGVDLSTDALKIAQENASSLNLNNIHFYQGSWWSPLNALQGKVTGMISNPPYIPSLQIAQLQPEVAWHEPRLALDGGDDGLDDIRYLIKTAPQYLVSGGIWLIELMVGQADTVVSLLIQQGEYYNPQIFADLAGIERFVLAYRR